MRLPRRTRLKLLTLDSLLETERSGEDIRGRLAAQNHPTNLAEFYTMMVRLEDDGLIEGRDERRIIEDVPIKERRYRITDVGRKEWKDSRDFPLQSGI